jgi:hypothetical protein
MGAETYDVDFSHSGRKIAVKLRGESGFGPFPAPQLIRFGLFTSRHKAKRNPILGTKKIAWTLLNR